MEWVETSAKTVDSATELALDELGVAEADAEIQVLEEPKPGLFGRVRGSARVKARVAPRTPRPKQDSRRRKGKGQDSGSGADKSVSGDRPESSDGQRKSDDQKSRTKASPKTSAKDEGPKADRKDAANQAAGSSAKNEKSRGARNHNKNDNVEREMMPGDEQVQVGCAFLQGLVDAFGLDAEVDGELREDGILAFEVRGEGLGLLIGPGLGTLDSVQEVCRNAIQHVAEGREYGKVRLDVAGARSDRTAALEEFTKAESASVIDSGEEVILEPMSRMDRKVVHDLVAGLDDLDTESVGEEPRRRIVIRPA